MDCLIRLIGIFLLMSGFMNPLTGSEGSGTASPRRLPTPPKPLDPSVVQAAQSPQSGSRPVGVGTTKRPLPQLHTQLRTPVQPNRGAPVSLQPKQSGITNQSFFNCNINANLSPVVVLSIDGAAVRGIAQLKIIKAIEEEVNRIIAEKKLAEAKRQGSQPIAGKEGMHGVDIKRLAITDIFDFMAGTSAGSLNTIALATPKNPKDANINGLKPEPKFTLDQLDERIPEILKAAFSNPFKRNVRVMYGLLGSKFTAKNLEAYLEEATGEARMSDTVLPILITSFDLVKDELMIFKTSDACSIKPGPRSESSKDSDSDVAKFQPTKSGSDFSRDFQRKEKNVYLWQAARASSAAQVFYKPLTIKIGGVERALVDAGLFVINPTLLALIEVQKLYPERRKIIISISGGSLVQVDPVQAKGATAGSIPKVVQRAFETALTGNRLSIDQIMKDISNQPDYNNLTAEEREKLAIIYHSLTFPVTNKNFDDMSDENIKALSDAPDVTIKSIEFKIAVRDIANAVWERMKKKDFVPFECNAKLIQKKNDTMDIVKSGTNLAEGTTEAQIKAMNDAATQKLKNTQGTPSTAAMQAEAEQVKAECLRLKQQKKTAEFKAQRCAFVLKDVKIG